MILCNILNKLLVWDLTWTVSWASAVSRRECQDRVLTDYRAAQMDDQLVLSTLQHNTISCLTYVYHDGQFQHSSTAMAINTFIFLAVFALSSIASQKATQIDPPCNSKRHVLHLCVLEKNRSSLKKHSISRLMAMDKRSSHPFVHSSIRILWARHIFSF